MLRPRRQLPSRPSTVVLLPVQVEPHLEMAASPTPWSRQRIAATVVSVVVHALIVAGPYLTAADYVPVPRGYASPRYRSSMGLVSPLFELPQASPGRARRVVDPDLELLRSARKLYAPRVIPKSAELPPEPPPDPDDVLNAAAADAPATRLAQAAPRGSGGSLIPAGGLPGRNDPAEQLAFNIIPPSNGAREQEREVVRSIRLIVGNADVPGGGAREGLGLPATAPGVGSSLELLSPARGADFRPYLTLLLTQLRKDWSRASVRQPAADGELRIEFSILRAGQVSDLTVTRSSTNHHWAEVVTSSLVGGKFTRPLPALYPDSSARIRLQFSCTSNVRAWSR